jgi:hypothetical protein
MTDRGKDDRLGWDLCIGVRRFFVTSFLRMTGSGGRMIGWGLCIGVRRFFPDGSGQAPQNDMTGAHWSCHSEGQTLKW